jgi:hypothetical protein
MIKNDILTLWNLILTNFKLNRYFKNRIDNVLKKLDTNIDSKKIPRKGIILCESGSLF